MAADELAEETGLRLSPDRLHPVGVRQLADTLSDHTQAVYAVELSEAEANELRADHAGHGNVAETERTYVEMACAGHLLHSETPVVDWTTLGIITQAIHASRPDALLAALLSLRPG